MRRKTAVKALALCAPNDTIIWLALTKLATWATNTRGMDKPSWRCPAAMYSVEAAANSCSASLYTATLEPRVGGGCSCGHCDLQEGCGPCGSKYRVPWSCAAFTEAVSVSPKAHSAPPLSTSSSAANSGSPKGGNAVIACGGGSSGHTPGELRSCL